MDADLRRDVSSLIVRPSDAVAILCAAAFVFYAILWGAEYMYPHSLAGTIVFVFAAGVSLAILWPDWNLRPAKPAWSWALLAALIAVTAIAVAMLARSIHLELPYDPSLNVVPLLPGVLAVTAIQEALYRQGMFRWLEYRRVAPRTIVITTAVIFAAGHLGPLVIGTTRQVESTLVQTLVLVWVGLLLGEIRRVTKSWLMSWLAHAGYNIIVLAFLSIPLW